MNKWKFIDALKRDEILTKMTKEQIFASFAPQK